MGLFAALNVGSRALHASQSAIDVTGQNISNANTEGYSRKRINQEALYRRDELYGQMGMGVEVSSVERVRNSFLDAQIYEQLGDKGYNGQIDKALERVENLFKEPTDGSLNDQIGKFYDAWQDLANNPSELSARESVKASTNQLTELFHSLSGQLSDYRGKMDELLQKKVDQVNDLSSRISQYNTEIATTEGQKGQRANDSRDQRDLMVRQLSELLDVSAIEDSQGRVSITTAGVQIVGPASSAPLETYGIVRQRADGSNYSTLGLRLSVGKRLIDPRGGEIKGILDSKDSVIPEFETHLDSMAKSIVEEVNAKHVQGYNLSANTGVMFFDPNKTQGSNITLSDAILSDSKNIAAATGGVASALQTVTPGAGIPAVGTAEDLRTTNPLFRNLIQGSVAVRLNSTGEQLQEGPGKDYVVDYSLGTVTFLNYAKFNPGDAVDIDFRYQANGYPGPGDGSNALSIAQIRQTATMSPDVAGTNTQTVNDYYAAFVGSLGIQRNQTTTALTTKEFIISQLDGEQTSLSGVSIDDEMVNMIKYEHSYQAAGRYISTVNSMLDTLMQMLG